MSDTPAPEVQSSDTRLEQALRIQQPYAVPLGLMSAVLDAVRYEPTHRQARAMAMPSRTGWAVAAVMLLAIGAYLTLGGPDLLADVTPVSPLASGNAQTAQDAVEFGIDGVHGLVGNFQSMTAAVKASQSALGGPEVWLPIAFGSILAGLVLSRRLSRGLVPRSESPPCAS